MVLQGGLVVVDQGNWMRSFYQEIVVDTTVLKIVHDSRPVASKVKATSEGIGLEQTAMAQQHVGHLQHRRHMDAVVVGVGGIVSLLYPVQVAAQLALIELELLDVASLGEEVESQQGQRVARGGVCQRKDVIVPVRAGILQHGSMSGQ